MKTRSRISAAILSLVMILSTLPLAVYAGDSTASDIIEQGPSASNVTSLADLSGSSITSEEVSKRTKREKHFKLDNGLSLAVMYNQPVHTLDEDGHWIDIDNAFVYKDVFAESDGLAGYVRESETLKTKISASSDGALVSLSDTENLTELSMRIAGNNLSPVMTEANEADAIDTETESDESGVQTVYDKNIRIIEEALYTAPVQLENAFDDVDIYFYSASDGLSEDIIIKNPPEDYSFSFALDTGELTPSVQENGCIEVRGGDDIRYFISSPYMYDSEGRFSDHVQYTLDENENGGYTLTMSADSEWLDSSETVFPVTLHSSVRSAAEEADNITGTYVSSHSPDTVYSDSRLTVGRNGEEDIRRAFIHLGELPALRETDIMLSAGLGVYPYYMETEEASTMIEARRITEEWDADTVTWARQPAFSDDDLYSSTYGGDAQIPENIVWDISELASDLYEGKETHGVALVSCDETDDAYFSMDLQPYVLVSYINIDQEETVSPEDPPEETPTEEENDEGLQKWENVDNILIGEDPEASDTAEESIDQAGGSMRTPEADREFSEINGITMQYCVGSADTWTSFSKTTGNLDQIDGIKLQTTSQEFYLKYYSKNVGVSSSILTPVYSTKSGQYDYAGLYGHAMTDLSIEVYTGNGTRVFDDYVVMYRAKVAGNWLAWVSNGDPDVMRTIKSEFGLDGDLDTGSTYAGDSGRGNIQALEIRMFRRNNISTSTGTAGTGDFIAADGITMQYRLTSSSAWETFSSTASFPSIEGIRLQTHGKPYYFRYAARDAVHGWNPYVSSWDSGQYDYAGYTYPITNIAIEVHTSSARVFDDYVVMYRAKVTGMGWLDWVSNGNPEIMDAIQADFNLPGKLDYNATDAGWSVNENIEALEIRVYERKNLNPTPSEDAVIIDAPYINQYNVGMPNGCESVSAVMALQHIEVSITPEQFVTKYLPMGSAPHWEGGVYTGSDPNAVFVGDPRSTGGWGCYAPVIINALNKFSNQYGFHVTDCSGQSLDEICRKYINDGIPVVMWATVDMTDQFAYRYWTTPDGTGIQYNNKLHCLLLVGYDEDNYYFNDPMRNKCKGFSKAKVQAAYDLLGCQALVIKNGTDPDETVVVPDSDETVKEPSEIHKKPSLSDEKVQDPIDLSTGAHVIDHTLMTIRGAQTISLGASYKSNLLVEGTLGTGWSHNFEKRLEESGSEIKVYDSPSYYAVYRQSSSDASLYTTDTITKENYTVTKSASGYTVNCNYKATEHYDTSGRLTKITAKGGLSTLVEYPTASTVKITDEVSGRYMILSKNADGKIISVTDNAGRTCTIGYEGSFLVSITDVNGHVLTYQYNDNGQVERGRDHTGTAYFTDTYDSAGRIISQKDAIFDSATTIISYDDTTEQGYTLVSVTDRTMQTTVYKYNGAKQLVMKTDPNGVQTSYVYDDAGNLTSKTDGLGNTARSVYDANNNLISSTDKLGNTTQYTYDSRNNLTQITYPGGAKVTNTYDTSNRLRSTIDLRRAVTVYQYNTQGLPVQITTSGKITNYTYQNGQAVSITDPLGRTVQNQYNAAGFLTSVTDADNNTTSYTYDNKGNVLTVTDAAGNVSSREYDTNGNVIKETDNRGSETLYTYNGNMKMTSMTLPTGGEILYEYDGEDRLVRTVYPDGTAAVNEYDAGGRLISATDRSGNTTSYEYDDANQVTKITNPLGGVTKKAYDAGGNVIRSTVVAQGYNEDYEPDGTFIEHTTSYTYDADGNLIKTVNAEGGETVYAYNAAGDLLTVTDPMGSTTANTYDSLGNLLTVTDPRGSVTTYTYDAVGNLLTVTNALGQVTTNTYDSCNRLISTSDPGGHTTSYTYDALGRMTSSTDARGNTTHQYYDSMGNIIKITDESNRIDYEAVYDAAGRATQVTDAAGSITTNVYDWAGNLIQQTNALNQSCVYTYNALGQVISAVDKSGGISYATYDGMGNLTSMTGPGGEIKEYIYNTSGQLFEKSLVNSSSYEVTTYNALGLKEKVFGASWEEADYTYDAAGRLTSVSDYTGTARYTYDANGNVLTARDSSGTIVREYDALNRVIRYEDTYDHVIEYEYDCCGNLTKMTYPTGDVAVYTYDANHNMVTSAMEGDDGSADIVTAYEYNPENQIKKIIKPDGSVMTKSYDRAGRLGLMNNRGADGKYMFVYIYTYDALGRLTVELNPMTMVEYRMTYDSLGRLTKRTELDKDGEILSEEVFTYDAAGNILTGGDTGNTDTYVYGEGNALQWMNSIRYGTDAYGNTYRCRLNGQIQNVTYDAKNRLKKINGDWNEYWYDADGNRIDMYFYHTNKRYTYDCSDGRHRLVWTDDHTTTETIYGYGADGLLWSMSEGEYQFYHYDYRGSVVAVTDINGNVTDTLKYDVYGEVTERTGESALIFGYNGQYGVLTDPNGLLYMRTRFYSPELRRFMNADVIDGSITDSTTLNLFTYVNGNPISFVDPFGLDRTDADNTPSSGLEFGWDFDPNASDYLGWGLDGKEIFVRTYNYTKYNFNVNKVGQYAIIKGAHTNAALSQGIKGTRYALKNADIYPNVFAYIDPITAGNEALKITSGGKINWGGALNYGVIAVDVGLGIYDNIQEGTRPQKIVTDAIVDAGVGAGTIWASTASGAAIGSIVPGAGNVVGAVGGFVVGGVIYVATDVIEINGKSAVEWTKEGVAWVGDGVVYVADWVGDRAIDLGDWIGDKWNNLW